MLTRLKVSGFKNLVDVDISFGPFTCIAGANGTGKSNLFDAINFLSNLTENNLIQAASKVRNEEGGSTDVRNIFHRLGDSYDNRMSFEAEMIISSEGIDDLGQKAQATITFVSYSLELMYQIDENSTTLGSIKILREELNRIKLGDFSAHMKFPMPRSGGNLSLKAGGLHRLFPLRERERTASLNCIKTGEKRGDPGNLKRLICLGLCSPRLMQWKVQRPF